MLKDVQQSVRETEDIRANTQVLLLLLLHLPQLLLLPFSSSCTTCTPYPDCR